MRLTHEELEVLIRYSNGYSFQETADIMDLSMNQAQTRLKNVRLKLGGRSYPHCIRIAFEQGILSLPDITLG